jgi:hypothetical protein
MATAEAWRRNIVNVQSTDVQIKRILDDLARNANRILQRTGGTFSADVRHAQISQAMASVLQLESDMFGKLTPIVESGKQESINIAMDAVRDLEARLGDNAGLFKYPFLQASRNNIENLRSRLLLDIDLSPQVYRTKALSAGWVQREVNRGILLGKSPKEIADSVRSMIRPDVSGGVSFAAFRLGRTELNNSFHETTIRGMEGKPWINAVNWNLSGSHPRHDICNILHDKGPYPSDKVPPKPHPQCLCYITAVTPPQDEFIRRLNNGEYDNWMDQNDGWNITDADLSGPAEEIKQRLIQYRVDGKSWAEIAKAENLGTPGSARRAFTKYTGSSDYKTKGTSIRRIIEGGKPTPPISFAPPQVTVAREISNIVSRGDAMDFLAKIMIDQFNVSYQVALNSAEAQFNLFSNNSVVSIARAVSEFQKAHPKIFLDLRGRGIRYFDENSRAMAVTEVHGMGLDPFPMVGFNSRYFAFDDFFEEIYLRNDMLNWFVSGNGTAASRTTWHELGHCLARSLSEDEQYEAYRAGRDVLARELGYDPDDFGINLMADALARKLVGTYSTHNMQEFFAEAYQNVMTSPNPLKWCQVVIDKLEGYYRARYGS